LLLGHDVCAGIETLTKIDKERETERENAYYIQELVTKYKDLCSIPMLVGEN
jgi:hypothetical protein